MAFRTVAEVMDFAAQMVSERADDPVFAGSTAEGTVDLIERWVTRTFDRIATWKHWKWAEDTISLTWPAATNSDASTLYLPHFIADFRSIPNPPHRTVVVISPAQFDLYRVGTRGFGGNDIIVKHGFYGIERDVGSQGAITATSSAGALDDGLQVRIQGLTPTNYDFDETVTLAAGTATTTGTVKAGVGGVRGVSIVPGTVPTAGQGIVTVTDAGGVTIERLNSANERAHEHIRTELYTSSGALTYTVRYWRNPFISVGGTDIIPIPEKFHDLIEDGIMMHLERHMRAWDAYRITREEWMQRMKEFQAWNNRTSEVQVPMIVRQWGGPVTWRY